MILKIGQVHVTNLNIELDDSKLGARFGKHQPGHFPKWRGPDEMLRNAVIREEVSLAIEEAIGESKKDLEKYGKTSFQYSYLLEHEKSVGRARFNGDQTNFFVIDFDIRFGDGACDIIVVDIYPEAYINADKALEDMITAAEGSSSAA